jgi:hypothetical protein
MLDPRSRGVGLLFEACDLILLRQRQTNVVQALEQAVLTVGIDVEPDHAAIWAADFLLFEIHGEARVGAAFGVIEQLFQILRANLDRQKAVLEAIIVKDVAE